MPRYKLRTLLMALAIGPPVLAIAIGAVAVVLRSRRPAIVEKIWPGMTLIDPDSDAMIHIFSDGRRQSGVPGLVAHLDDERPGIRRAAAGWLGAIGSPAKGAIPALKKLRDDDEDPRVREEAGEAIERILTPPSR
jgi:hypothetical protein